MSLILLCQGIYQDGSECTRVPTNDDGMCDIHTGYEYCRFQYPDGTHCPMRWQSDNNNDNNDYEMQCPIIHTRTIREQEQRRREFERIVELIYDTINNVGRRYNEAERQIRNETREENMEEMGRDEIRREEETRNEEREGTKDGEQKYMCDVFDYNTNLAIECNVCFEEHVEKSSIFECEHSENYNVCKQCAWKILQTCWENFQDPHCPFCRKPVDEKWYKLIKKECSCYICEYLRRATENTMSVSLIPIITGGDRISARIQTMEPIRGLVLTRRENVNQNEFDTVAAIVREFFNGGER